jgi:hypothetical protein
MKYITEDSKAINTIIINEVILIRNDLQQKKHQAS